MIDSPSVTWCLKERRSVMPHARAGSRFKNNVNAESRCHHFPALKQGQRCTGQERFKVGGGVESDIQVGSDFPRPSHADLGSGSEFNRKHGGWLMASAQGITLCKAHTRLRLKRTGFKLRVA
jgi:hypothetical protein